MKIDAAPLSICDQLTVADLYCAFSSASYSNTLIAVRYYLTIIYNQLTAIGIILIYMNGIARKGILGDAAGEADFAVPVVGGCFVVVVAGGKRKGCCGND